MPSSVLYDAAIGGSVNLRQVRSTNFSANNTIVPDYTSGGIDPSALFFHGARPQVSFTTTDLATVIANFDEQNGLHISSGSGTIGIPWQKRANGGTFAGTLSHYKLTADRGLFVPVSYSANQGDSGGATVDIQGTFYSTDGTTSPVVAADGTTLGSTAYVGSFRLAPFFIDGTQLAGLTGVTVNTGITTEPEETDGDLYPTEVYITRRLPTMTLRFRDAHQLATYGPLFSSGSAVVGYFRKRDPGGSVVADATTAHCSFTFADYIIDANGLSGSDNSAAEPSITITGEALTVATGVAVDLTP